LSCLAVFRSAAKVSGHPAFVTCASLMSVPEPKKCRKDQTSSALMRSEIFELRSCRHTQCQEVTTNNCDDRKPGLTPSSPDVRLREAAKSVSAPPSRTHSLCDLRVHRCAIDLNYVLLFHVWAPRGHPLAASASTPTQSFPHVHGLNRMSLVPMVAEAGA
jgi:hypothetical protein